MNPLRVPGRSPHKPGCNGALDAKPTTYLNFVAPAQAVLFDLGYGRQAEGRLRAWLGVWEGGADGQARLEMEEPYPEGGSGVLVIIVAFTDATVREVEGRAAVAFAGAVRVCPERDGECRDEEAVGEIAQERDGDMSSFSLVTPSVQAQTRVRARYVFADWSTSF